MLMRAPHGESVRVEKQAPKGGTPNKQNDEFNNWVAENKMVA